MVTAQDVHSVTFDKGMRGYHTEQVDQFLDQVAAQMEQDAQRIDELNKTVSDLQDKLRILARKIEEYRADEDNLKSALINAQRMGENVVREAKQKADNIEREAKIRAEDTIRSAADRCREEEIEYERIRAEVSQFKADILGLYRQHIESLSTLPEVDTEEQQPEAPAPAQPEAPVVIAPEAPAPLPEPVAVAEEVQPAAPAQPAATLWDKDETALRQQPAAPAQPAADPTPIGADAFRGIRFSE